MTLTPMRYKDYCWPHNPASYSIRYQRKVAVHKVPFGRYCMQDMGLSYRVMQGAGEFVGEGAYDEFRKLAVVFYQDGPGLLTHPVWMTASAYFVSLELTQKPRPDYVQYRFEFWESREAADEGAATPAQPAPSTEKKETEAVYHTVVRGETLWGIAQTYGVSLQTLIARNPQIKNPNLIYGGNRVRIR